MQNDLAITEQTPDLSKYFKNLIEYKSHKIVHAEPMNQGEYNRFKGFVEHNNENADKQGYLVIYSKDTEDEYISWSPKHVFEAGYNETAQKTEPETENTQAMIQEMLEGGTPEAKIEFYVDWLRELVLDAGGQTEAAKLISKYTAGFSHDRTTIGKFLRGNGNVTSIILTTVILRAALDFYENKT